MQCARLLYSGITQRMLLNCRMPTSDMFLVEQGFCRNAIKDAMSNRNSCCSQTRMQRLEGVRLEVDSRRRTVAELARKIDRQRAKLPQTRSKGEFEMEQTIKKMQHKENKLSGEMSLLCQVLPGDPACTIVSIHYCGGASSSGRQRQYSLCIVQLPKCWSEMRLHEFHSISCHPFIAILSACCSPWTWAQTCAKLFASGYLKAAQL